MRSAPNQHPTTVLIRKLESIATLTDAERRAIESLPVRVHHLDARQDIVRDGDKTTHCCLVLDGWVWAAPRPTTRSRTCSASCT